VTFTIGDTIKITLTDGESFTGMVVENERGFLVLIGAGGERFVCRIDRCQSVDVHN
jgi:hypothetical protein